MAKPRTIHTVMNELIERSNSDSQRLRILEQRSEITATRVRSLEQDSLNQIKQIHNAMNKVDNRITRIEERVSKMESNIREIVKRFKSTATKVDVKEIETTLELYNPMKSNFITREEAKNLIVKRNKKNL